MSKILIWRQIISGSDIDIFGKTDYRTLHKSVQEMYGFYPNWGNKLWFQGICSEISTPENEIHYRTDETIDQINTSYDMIVYPMANYFKAHYVLDNDEIVSILKQIKIPVYIVACGAEAENYGDIENLVKQIGTPSSRFIEAVYATGGEFALRGYFTKEFFERLGFSSAVVTGCPSMYQRGENLQISTDKVSVEDIVPVFTGKIKCFEPIMKRIPESVYLSQGEYGAFLYDSDFFKNRSIKNDIHFSHRYGTYLAELLGTGRIKMITDTNDWYHYFVNHSINFAFGTKIHGSIMPILAGTPAMIVPLNSRTREMAEFFDIPCYKDFSADRIISTDDFFEAYESMDYSKFNANFKKRFSFYEQFLVDHGIVSKINGNNCFFNDNWGEDYEAYQPNRAAFANYAKKLKVKAPVLEIGKLFLR